MVFFFLNLWIITKYTLTTKTHGTGKTGSTMGVGWIGNVTIACGCHTVTGRGGREFLSPVVLSPS